MELMDEVEITSYMQEPDIVQKGRATVKQSDFVGSTPYEAQ